jgi:hypothetical protein
MIINMHTRNQFPPKHYKPYNNQNELYQQYPYKFRIL